MTPKVGAYPGGVWWADIATLSDGELVPQLVASAVGIADQPGRRMRDVLVDVLRHGPVLLVLDNTVALV